MKIVTRYKKTALCAMLLVGMNVSASETAKCTPCQAAAAARQSIRDAAIAAGLIAGKPVVREMELDDSAPQCSVRAPREPISSSCDTCGDEEEVCPLCPDEETDCCDVVNYIACQVMRQGRDARKCCKKIKHELKDIEELIETQIDQSAECCSVIETRIGDLGQPAVTISPCDFSLIDTVNSTNADVISWLKGLYILLSNVYQCTCECNIG